MAIDKELQKLINEHMPKRYYGHEARKYAAVIAILYAKQQVMPPPTFIHGEGCIGLRCDGMENSKPNS